MFISKKSFFCMTSVVTWQLVFSQLTVEEIVADRNRLRRLMAVCHWSRKQNDMRNKTVVFL